MRPHVVILGGGFGGLNVARDLGSAPVQVTLIDRSNHHLFQPLLYQVATAGLSPAAIATPIRSVLKNQTNVDVLMAEVLGVNAKDRTVLIKDRQIKYDILVVALGTQYNYFGRDEWRKFAPSLKSIVDATRIRRKILLAFEAAEMEQDPEKRKALLTFVLVGAGPTGVEMAGSIAELAHQALKSDFRHIDPRSTRILLIEAGARILGGFPSELSEKAAQKLKSLGVEILNNTRVGQADEDGVTLLNERVQAKTIIWCAGVKASPAGKWLNAEVDRLGRVQVGSDLSVPGHPDVFVIGDTACLMQDGKPLPCLAPVALQQGSYVARLIRKRIEGAKPLAPFRYLNKGNLATVGRSYAVADVNGLTLSGLTAWLTWVVVHIYFLIGFRNRWVVLSEWAWAYFTYQRGARLITIEVAPEEQPQKTI